MDYEQFHVFKSLFENLTAQVQRVAEALEQANQREQKETKSSGLEINAELAAQLKRLADLTQHSVQRDDSFNGDIRNYMSAISSQMQNMPGSNPVAQDIESSVLDENQTASESQN